VLAIDETKVRANASGQRSLRHETQREEERRLQELVERLLQQAAQTDAEEDLRWGKGQSADPLPPGLAKAEERLRRIREAKQILEQEAQEQLVACRWEFVSMLSRDGGHRSTSIGRGERS